MSFVTWRFLVPAFAAAKPRSTAIEVRSCLGVRYAKVCQVNISFRWPVSPSAYRKPACSGVSSDGLLNLIHELCTPVAFGAIRRPAATPLWKSPQAVDSSGIFPTSGAMSTFCGKTRMVYSMRGIA